MAVEAERFGRSANDDVAKSYLLIAEQWRRMAQGIEASLNDLRETSGIDQRPAHSDSDSGNGGGMDRGDDPLSGIAPER
jgi:hypothetical protein